VCASTWHPQVIPLTLDCWLWAPRKVPEEGTPLLWESSFSTFTLTTEGCPQAIYNWCTPLCKCGWVPSPTRTHSCTTEGYTRPENTNSNHTLPPATTTQVLGSVTGDHHLCNHQSGVGFGAWSHHVCNHQWEAFPLLVLWFGVGIPP
jgi:hypothetical protein